MDQKKAQIFFIIANILAIPIVGYAFYDFYFVTTAIANGKSEIPFDSGTYYFLLGSIFWVFLLVQQVGLKNPDSKVLHYANHIFIIWFIAILVLANVIPFYLQNKFEDAGYKKCHDPAEISRVFRGGSSIYVKGSCPEA
jgi:hypothetical protein